MVEHAIAVRNRRELNRCWHELDASRPSAEPYAIALRNRRELSRRWRELNTRRTTEGAEKLCGCCQEWLPLDEGFFGFMLSRGHFRSYCRFCESEKQRNRRLRKRGLH